MNCLASFKVKPNKRYINLILCWVVLGLAFFMSFVPSMNRLIAKIAYEGDWLQYRLIRALCNMIVSRMPLYLVLVVLVGCTVWVLLFDRFMRVQQIKCFEDYFFFMTFNDRKPIKYKDVVIKLHSSYLEMGSKKDWLLRRVIVEDRDEFLAFLKERGVSFEK